ncbi:MAG: hypothetical protein ABIH92_05035 [Nanoarchaeota archaeon]
MKEEPVQLKRDDERDGLRTLWVVATNEKVGVLRAYKPRVLFLEPSLSKEERRRKILSQKPSPDANAYEVGEGAIDGDTNVYAIGWYGIDEGAVERALKDSDRGNKELIDKFF